MIYDPYISVLTCTDFWTCFLQKSPQSEGIAARQVDVRYGKPQQGVTELALLYQLSVIKMLAR